MIQVIWKPPDRISMDEWYRDKRDTFGSWNVNAMIGWCDIEMWNVSLYPTGLTSPISWSAEDRLFAISNRNSYGRFSFKIPLVCQLRFKEVTQKIKKNQNNNWESSFRFKGTFPEFCTEAGTWVWPLEVWDTQPVVVLVMMIWAIYNDLSGGHLEW